MPQNWPIDNYKNITSCWILRVGITNLIRISPSFKWLWIACEGSNIFYSSGKLVYWRYCMTKFTHPDVEDYHLPWIGTNDLWNMQGLCMWKWLNIAKFQLHWNKVLFHNSSNVRGVIDFEYFISISSGVLTCLQFSILNVERILMIYLCWNKTSSMLVWFKLNLYTKKILYFMFVDHGKLSGER